MAEEPAALAQGGTEPGPAPRRPKPSWALVGLFLIVAVAAIAYARTFLVPVVLAFLLSLVFSPVRRWLGRKGVPDALSALAITVALLVLVLTTTALLAAPVGQWVERLPELGREVEQKVRGILGAAQAVIEASDQVQQVASSGEDDAVEVVVQDRGPLATIAFGAPMIVAQGVFVLVLFYFVTASGDMFYEKIVQALPTFHDKRRAIRIAYDIERELSRYLLTITLINAGLGLGVGLGFWAIGMPNPLLFGVIGLLFNFVPYIGAIAGTAISLFVGLVAFDYVGTAILAGGLYFGLTTIEGQFVTPYFVGRRLRLNTVVIFMSVALWAWLWSVMGMLLAVPLLVTIRSFCEHVPSLQPLGNFLAARGAETPLEGARSDEGG